MPSTGDHYTVELLEVHLRWGTLSREGNRNRSDMEVYIPIPVADARRLDIPQGAVYEAYSNDGHYNHPLKAAGSQGNQLEYGKNFESQGDLKILGYWLKNHCDAHPGDQVEVRWVSETEIVLTHISA